MESDLPHILIEIIEGRVIISTNATEHDDVVMYWLIESIYALRNKQFQAFKKKQN